MCEDLNSILFAQSNRYCKILQQGAKHDYLHPQNLTEYICYKLVDFHYTQVQVMTNRLCSSDDINHYSLETASLP